MAKMRAQTAGLTGLNTYFTIADANGQVWNGSAIVARSTAARNAGGINADGYDDGTYDADIPATLPASDVPYVYTLWQRLTGSPLESDTVLAGPGLLPWNGTSQIGSTRLVTPAEAAGLASTLEGMMRQVWEEFANKRDRNVATGVRRVFAADNTTVLRTQTQSTAGDVDQVTKAS
jgi:hypothetical protein